MDLFDQAILRASDPVADSSELLAELNPQQADAVRHVNGPLLILAGAGSGKTRVITHRIAWLVAKHQVRPSAILAITFTNKAAAEMKQRIEALVGSQSQYMWIGTFHAMMLRILRRFADRIGYQRSFAIMDRDDQQRLVKACLQELNFSEKTFAPRAVHSQISNAKNDLIGVEEFARKAGNDFRLSKTAEVYRLYQEKLKKANSMDFDDILFESVRLFRENPDVLNEYQVRFRYILVDEYQDTNHAQYQLIHLLSAGHRNLCVVGDDDQSIYSFRGANIRNILDFEKDFKGCKVIKLEQNYRSTGTVLEAANTVIKENKGRKAKKLWTNRGQGDPITFLRAENHSEEGRYIATEINRVVSCRDKGKSYRDIAILYRLNALSRSLEFALREQGLPYRIFGGQRFYDRKEIRDVLAWLRLIRFPGDDFSLVRAIQVPRRGIGAATLERLDDLAAREGKDQLEICRHATLYPELQRMADRLQGFAAQIDFFRNRLLQNDMSFAEYVEWIENESGLIQEIVDRRERSGEGDPVDRIENLKELLSDAVEFENSLRRLRETTTEAELPPEDRDLLADDLPGVLSSFLERAALYSEMDEDRENQDYVRLMTIHSAKGLEFDLVFLVGAEEGLFPGYRAYEDQEAIEEERRLAYVAITRAREKLYITTARQRLVFGQTQSMPVSRFVRGIPDHLVEEIGGSRQGEQSGRSGRTSSGGWLSDTLGIRSPAAPKPGSGKQPVVDTKEPIDFKKGDRIRHPRFGPGRIIACEPVAGDAILQIEFDSGERKRFLARMARLEKI
ncbi:MAG: ATP-dependent helicase [Saccharofermentanales bacterium]